MLLRLLGCFVLLGLFSTVSEAQRVSLQEGRTFPAIAFPTLDGSQLKSIADFRGQKVVLINFASW